MIHAYSVLLAFCMALYLARPIVVRRRLRQYSTKELEAELRRRDITVKVKLR